jgi:hypothetical protein
MLPLRHENEGFEFAKVVPDDTFRKRGSTDETLDTVLEGAVEEFVYAAEDFIASTANSLGLTAANPSNAMGLAA